MKKNVVTTLETVPFTAERDWVVDGIAVLSAAISLPRPVQLDSPVARRIDRFYRMQSRSYLRYCERFLFPQAAAEYHRALSVSAPLPQYTAVMTYHVTCFQNGVFSLYTQTMETLGARREVHRRGDTWDLSTGYPLPLSACFPHRFSARKMILAAADEEICKQQQAGCALYYENWRQALRRWFRRENFYLTPEELHVFWQMLTIAPAAEGIPDFKLAFDGECCRWPVPQVWGEASQKKEAP